MDLAVERGGSGPTAPRFSHEASDTLQPTCASCHPEPSMRKRPLHRQLLGPDNGSQAQRALELGSPLLTEAPARMTAWSPVPPPIESDATLPGAATRKKQESTGRNLSQNDFSLSRSLSLSLSVSLSPSPSSRWMRNRMRRTRRARPELRQVQPDSSRDPLHLSR